MASALVLGSKRVPRHLAWDAFFVLLSLVHATVLLERPSIVLIALGMWWNANTIAHNFIHRPFFPTRALNRLYSVFLSLLLGLPQTLWRDRHLQHHAEIAPRLRLTTELAIEAALVGALWSALVAISPRFFVTVYLPGWLIGLGLCQLQGHYEHARGTTSHYGRFYNLLFFNDGFHVEHHRRPTAHWTELGRLTAPDTRKSVWPPVLRWLDVLSLEGLERLVLRSPRLQQFVLSTHERAFRRLVAGLGDIQRITVVGGGLFPRSAIVLRRLLPSAEITIIDADADHLALARPFLGEDVHLVHRAYQTGSSDASDLVVIPLALIGDRRVVYARPPARAVLVHDWIWAARRDGVVISWLLLKRLNLVRG